VITLSRAGTVDVWDIGTRNSSWYLVETNYDHWKSAFILDDRRDPARKCLDQRGQQNVGFAEIYDVLSSRPVLNKLTTYTALMNVETGHLETYLQVCPDPCFPW
jgi:acid ceramidase